MVTKEIVFQIWNSIAVGVLALVAWVTTIQTNSILPPLTLLLLSIRFTALLVQRILVVILVPRLGNISPLNAEDWYRYGRNNPTIFHHLFAFSSYMTISIFIEFAAWLIALYNGPTHFYRTAWLILTAYTVLSIFGIYFLSYQPWRGDASKKLLREAFVSAAYDLPLSFLIITTYLVYADTEGGIALLLFTVGFTLSKFVRYWAMGLGLRRELLFYHTTFFSFLQPVAIILMAIGFLCLH